MTDATQAIKDALAVAQLADGLARQHGEHHPIVRQARKVGRTADRFERMLPLLAEQLEELARLTEQETQRGDAS